MSPSPRTHGTLSGILAKLARAEEHLATMDADVTRFFARKPYQITRQIEAKGTEYAFYVHVVEEPSPYLSLLAGDILQNLRTSLDHLVWQLAIVNGHAKPPRSTSFPITQNQDLFFENDGAKFSPRSGAYKIDAIGPEPKAIIEDLQPYNRGDINSDPLWLLNELARVDRHQVLHLVGSMTTSTTYSVGRRDAFGRFEVAPFSGSFRDQIRFGQFKDGAEVARFYITPADPDVDVDLQFFMTVSLGDGGPPMDILTRINQFVRNRVLGDLGPYIHG